MKKSGGLVADDQGNPRLYSEIKIQTELRKSNEYFIYDTPDVNLSLLNEVRIWDERQSGDKQASLTTLNARNNHWVKDGSLPKEQQTEAWLYDIYFLTGEPANALTTRMAEYEQRTLNLDRFNIITNQQGMTSELATVPKNILVEKPAGEPLTADEQAQIDAAGGLYKKVGRGFKVRIKNYDSQYYAAGGYLNLTFYSDPVNESTMLNADGKPIYVNKAAFFAQEIPNCDPAVDQNCTPIKHEGSTPEDVKAGGDGYSPKELVPPGITAETSDYQQIDFVKRDDTGAALAGATFTVYHVNADGSRGDIAKNEAGEQLENLVTKADGKLYTATGTAPVVLSLKRGNYLFVEVQAPTGYTKAADTIVGVQFAQKTVEVLNTKAPDPGTDPGSTPDPGSDPDPGNDPGTDPGSTPDPGGDPGVTPGEPTPADPVEEKPVTPPTIHPSKTPRVLPKTGV